MHDALGNSLNIPAFKTALYVGVPNVADEYKKFGMTTIGDSQQYGPSVTIGGVDIRLYDVAYAYTVLANNGVMRGVPTPDDPTPRNRTLDPVTILQVTRQSDGAVLYPTTEDHRVQVQEQQIVKPQYAYMITSILSDPNAFCHDVRLRRAQHRAAVGREDGGEPAVREQPRRSGETWTYGYTPDLVAGVWAGNADNSPVYNILVHSISYRAVRDFMIEALANTPVSQFSARRGCRTSTRARRRGCWPTRRAARKVKNLLPDATTT